MRKARPRAPARATAAGGPDGGRGCGHHRFHGVFIAAGPSIRAGQRLDEVSITDVAPLVLYSLDVPIPDDLDGSLPVDIFEPGALSRRAPRYESRDAEDTILTLIEPVELDGDDEVLVLDRLRALGYVE